MNPVIKADDDGADVLSGPDTVIFIQNFYTGIVNVETPDTLGGARLKFLGSITPTNLQPQMIMDYGQVDDTTRINMYSLSSEFFIEGPLISFTGDGVLVYADASDTAGTMLTSVIEVITDIIDDSPNILPANFTLAQNYPNPFNAGTQIEFTLNKSVEVTLKIFDITGRNVHTIYQGDLSAGEYSFDWRADDEKGRELPSGVYFYRLNTGDNSLSRKMLLLK